MKKYFLFFAVMLALLPTSIISAQNFEVDGIRYSANIFRMEATVLPRGGSYVYSQYRVSIPSSVEYKGDNYTVTDIDDNAFKDCIDLETVSIPNSVTTIGSKAFFGCSKLKSITIPDSVTKIGEYAFYNCGKLKSLIIPNSVKSIGRGAFSFCTGLSSITLPDSLTRIEDYTFNYCPLLSSVNIPLSVKYIGERAFSTCGALTSVIIPHSVENVGDYVFNECTNLHSITIDSDCAIKYADNIFNGIDSIALIIGNSVSCIENGAFSGATFVRNAALNSLEISNPDTKIEESAFAGCANLKSVKLPNGTSHINKQVFANCSNLSEITIPPTVSTIGEEAFMGCSSLTSITIPESVTIVDNGVFSDCTGLTSIVLLSNDIGGNEYFYTFEGVGTEENPCTLFVNEDFDRNLLGDKHIGEDGNPDYYIWKRGYFSEPSLVTGLYDAVAKSQTAKVVGYYDLNGNRIEALQKGINVVRYSDGTVKKVLAK